MATPTVTTSVANVKVATTGRILVAPLGTALPTGSQAAPNVAFQELGWISEAGVSETNGDSTNKIHGWQGGAVIREVQTQHDLTYHFVAVETSPVVLTTYYGNYAAGKVEINGIQPGAQEWIIDAIDGVDMIRVVIPYGQITARGDVTYVNGDPIGYDMTIEAYPDPAYAGSLSQPAKAYKYLYDVSGGTSV